MKFILGLVGALVVSSSAFAQQEYLYCRFENDFEATSIAKMNMLKGTLITKAGYPKEVRRYEKAYASFASGGPYGSELGSFMIMVFDDVPALYVKQTFRATLASEASKVFPYEAYWGSIPGKVEPGFFDRMTNQFSLDQFLSPLEKQYGPRGVCWTTSIQPLEVRGEGSSKTYYPMRSAQPLGELKDLR